MKGHGWASAVSEEFEHPFGERKEKIEGKYFQPHGDIAGNTD